MTDKEKTPIEKNGFIIKTSDKIDDKNEDLAALDRNLVHTVNNRSNKKTKVIGVAVGCIFVVLCLSLVVLSQFFKKGEAVPAEITKEQREMYAKDENKQSLAEQKNNILNAEKALEEEAKEKASHNTEENQLDTKAPPVALPATATNTPDSNNEQPLTPEQRKLQGNILLDGGNEGVDREESNEEKSKLQQNIDDFKRQGKGDFLQGATYADGSVEKIKNRQYLLSAATSISCVLKTKIITSYPSVTMCQITKDVYSDDGKTVLIRAGALLQGEQTQVMNQGVARVFVNWTTVKDGNVSVRIDALGAGNLGAAGLPAWIDNHFWQRFGGAIMLSFIQDSVAAGSSQLAKSNVNANNTENSAQELAKLALENSVNIPPTAYVNQGEMLSVIVPRNIDFSTVYEVK